MLSHALFILQLEVRACPPSSPIALTPSPASSNHQPLRCMYELRAQSFAFFRFHRQITSSVLSDFPGAGMFGSASSGMFGSASSGAGLWNTRLRSVFIPHFPFLGAGGALSVPSASSAPSALDEPESLPPPCSSLRHKLRRSAALPCLVCRSPSLDVVGESVFRFLELLKAGLLWALLFLLTDFLFFFISEGR